MGNQNNKSNKSDTFIVPTYEKYEVDKSKMFRTYCSKCNDSMECYYWRTLSFRSSDFYWIGFCKICGNKCNLKFE